MESGRDKLSGVIAEEAAEWVVRLTTGEPSARERRQFIAWLKRSPGHLSAYLGIERTWADLGNLDPARRIDVEALLATPEDNVVRLGEDRQEAEAAGPSHRRFAIALAACALLASIGIAWFQVHFANRYTTGVGEQRTVKLSDGSTVVLNTDTTVRVSFTDAVREVELLEGEALFDVAKNPARPFRVRSDRVIAQAVGTSFVVRKKTAETIVTVIEGQVAVVDTARLDVVEPTAILQQAVHVSAGTRADVVESNIQTTPVANPAAVTSWRSGRLIFDGAPLSDVVAEFNRYNEVQLVLVGTELSDERISGVFDADQPLALARFLERSGAIAPIQPGAGTVELVPQARR
ncbi:MAG TPA: FecR domain-containing protein [Steroidobacteraceae bacterium]|jgi:transmembrane sensor